MTPHIIQVKPTKDYIVYVFFDNGIIKEYSLKSDIEAGGVFEKIKDVNIFIDRCTIMNGTLAWDISGDRDTTKCIDICPDTIYKDGVTIKDIDVA